MVAMNEPEPAMKIMTSRTTEYQSWPSLRRVGEQTSGGLFRWDGYTRRALTSACLLEREEPVKNGAISRLSDIEIFELKRKFFVVFRRNGGKEGNVVA